MHEFSISSEIVNSVLATVEKNKGKKVLSVQLEIGELTHLNGEQVSFWVRELFKGSVAEGAEFKMKTIKTLTTEGRKEECPCSCPLQGGNYGIIHGRKEKTNDGCHGSH